MAQKTVYIETSVVSYLTARPTTNLLAAAWQKITIDWWEEQKSRFDLYTSEITLQEAGRGDQEAGRRRLAVLSEVPVLPTTEVVGALASALLRAGALPNKALNDALHIAHAAAHGIDYLLTWNYKHLDNAITKPTMRDTCNRLGYTCPEICTPRELMLGLGDGG